MEINIQILKKLEVNEKERQAEFKQTNIVIDGIPEDTNGPLTSKKTTGRHRRQHTRRLNLNSIQLNLYCQQEKQKTTFMILVKLSSPTVKYEFYKHVKLDLENSLYFR